MINAIELIRFVFFDFISIDREKCLKIYYFDIAMVLTFSYPIKSAGLTNIFKKWFMQQAIHFLYICICS